MLKQTINFTDYNDEERTVVEYFHLSEAEIVDLQAHSQNGIQEDMENAVKSNDVAVVLDFIKDLVHRSYGKKTNDGLRFDKSEELVRNFINSAYYSDFLLGLIQDDGAKGIAFIQGIMPKKLLDRALAQATGQPDEPAEQDTRTFQPDARQVFAQANETPTTVINVAPVSDAQQDREYQEWLNRKNNQA